MYLHLLYNPEKVIKDQADIDAANTECFGQFLDVIFYRDGKEVLPKWGAVPF